MNLSLITAWFIRKLCQLVSYLPVPLMQLLARLIAVIIIHSSARSYNRVQTNLLLTNLANEENIIKMSKTAVLEFARTMVEILFMVWTGRYKSFLDRIAVDPKTDQILRTAINSGQRILFLTPHIGNFELSIEYLTIAYQVQTQVLYKPTKVKFLNYLMNYGMQNPYIKFCSVRNRKEVLSAIKNFRWGSHIGMLPDSIASQNNGVWVEFFGQQIFASSLAASMAAIPDTIVIIGACVRVHSGYRLFVEQVKIESQDKQKIMQQLYCTIEQIIRQYPEQYFWSYDRFRIPKYLK